MKQVKVHISEDCYKMLISMAGHRGRTVSEELDEAVRVRNYLTFSNENQQTVKYRRNKLKGESYV